VRFCRNWPALAGQLTPASDFSGSAVAPGTQKRPRTGALLISNTNPTRNNILQVLATIAALPRRLWAESPT